MAKGAHKVLVVDDSRLMHSLYECLLPDKDLVHASDGCEALELLERHRDTDLVVLDAEVPEMDGITVLSRLRSEPHLRDIPVLLVTNRNGRDQAQRGMDAGATAFIAKPFHASDLVNLVEAILLPAGPMSGERSGSEA